MSRYILNREDLKTAEQKKSYKKSDLELMTTHQLREICRKEKIIQGMINPMDKEELIHVIMRYRGTREEMLILQETEQGQELLAQLLEEGRIVPTQDKTLHIPSKMITYAGLAMNEYDRMRIPYRKELEDTNAILVSGGKKVCGIFYLRRLQGDTEHLYVTKSEKMTCQEADLKDYDLLCFRQRESDRLFSLYHGIPEERPEKIPAFRIPLMDVEVREPIPLRMPLVIDFGSTNTTAGVYLDSLFFENAKGASFADNLIKNAIQYTVFEDRQKLMPSVVGVISVSHGKPQFVFGQTAMNLSNASYVDEGFCIFYDMKRWISDYEKEEEITDREGRRTFLARKDIIRAYFEHIITVTENQFKCKVGQIQVSCPVKQKFLFQKLFQEILPEYIMQEEEMLDEGVSVLYNTISNMLASGDIDTNRVYQALIVDCGGGTTDLCACHFRVRDDRVAYHIQIDTAYENGDTDFGGNNLTYRIMQYLKILLAEKLGFEMEVSTQDILHELDMDIFRYVDANGTEELYRTLEEAYGAAEIYIPTRFREYEARSREEYFKVKNNFYLLFFLAERVKKHFYEQEGILRVGITSTEKEQSDIIWIQADKWKLSVQGEDGFQIVKEFPEMVLNLYELELILKGDIYGIIRKFMEPLYQQDKIRDFSFLKLTGQSCKIDIFREALKEFIPGRMIQFKRRNRGTASDIDLKMSCVDGALKFMKDKKLGYAEIELHSDKPVLPYTVSAYTHNGSEVELINGFLREDTTGYVSRNLDDITLQLFLKDTEGRVRYRFNFDCQPEQFREVTYEDIRKVHGDNILQKETDSIVNHEIKFFAWKRCRDWGYVIVPVYRNEEALYLGKEQFYPFEHEGWVRNYFDGMK